MAQYRPFAIWDGTSALPSGIDQSQNILIGVADQNYYNLGGFDWWAGPDESLGYVIAYYDQTFTHPNPLNISCGIGFLRSSALTDVSFLELFNHLMAKLELSPILNANDAKTWLLANGYWTSYGETAWTFGNSVTPQSQPSGPSSGAGEWFFYSTSGTLDVGPPLNAGNFIITQNEISGSSETYDPNFDGSTPTMIHLNVADSTNTSFLTEFNNLVQNGGTINLTQNGQTATYTSSQIGIYMVNNSSFCSFPANIQTTSTEGPFTYNDPISVSFGPAGSTTWFWNAGDPSQSGQFAISANNSSNLTLVTNIFVNNTALDNGGANPTDISTLLNSVTNGSTVKLQSVLYPTIDVTYTVTSKSLFGSNGTNLGVTYVSGSGSITSGLWEIQFI